MNKIAKRVIAIILFVLAAIILAYGIWSLVYAHDYVSSLIEMGQIVVEDDVYSVVNFYVTNSAEYFVYTISLVVFGIFFLLTPTKLKEEKKEKEEKPKKVKKEEK